MNEIYSLDSIADLEGYLSSKPKGRTRNNLIRRFHKLAFYNNAEQWNQAVRLCEALAIVGWGASEPVEAIRTKAWNGNPATGFRNKDSQERFVHADWSKRKSGLTLQENYTNDYGSPDLPDFDENAGFKPVQVTECVQDISLATQRNWIPKNPIHLTRGIANCYKTSEFLVEEISEILIPRLDKEMSPDAYGSAINRIHLKCCFSYSDKGSATNYVTLDEDIRISNQDLYKRLCKMFSKKEIDANNYFLRKRYDFGNFNKAKGTMTVDICFTREFSKQSKQKQRGEFAEHIENAVEGAIVKLKKKKLDYDFGSMQSDLTKILQSWKT